MTKTFRSAIATAGLALAAQAGAQVTFYEQDGFQGRSFATDRQVVDFDRIGYNDRASSAVVLSGRWEVCDDARFGGRCVVLRTGRYDSLAAFGLENKISSTRPVQRSAQVADSRYAPVAAPVYDNRRRVNERLYEAPVTSVHAVMGAREQRCWTEHDSRAEHGGANVPGAVLGAVLGGVLGHQVGGGTGRDIATAGGAVAGAAIGANVNRDGRDMRSGGDNIRRCDSGAAAARPSYWDVTYSFRGQEHRIQTTTPPGATVQVNRQGEPRA